MATKLNLTPSLTKGQPPTLRVRIVCDCETSTTGVILPRNTEGTVLEYLQRNAPYNDLVIDFPGVGRVFLLPPNSPLIEFVNGS